MVIKASRGRGWALLWAELLWGALPFLSAWAVDKVSGSVAWFSFEEISPLCSRHDRAWWEDRSPKDPILGSLKPVILQFPCAKRGSFGVLGRKQLIKPSGSGLTQTCGVGVSSPRGTLWSSHRTQEAWFNIITLSRPLLVPNTSCLIFLI